MQIFYPESKFGGFTGIDGTIAFYSRVQALANPDSVVIDFGCGRGAYAHDTLPYRRSLHIFKGRVQRVIGLDVNPGAAGNPFIDEFHLLKDEQPWPLADGSADLCFSDNVIEHMPKPELFFREAARVLRPGGIVCVRTPNRWNYISVLAQIIPNSLHVRVLAKAKVRLREEDIFPTLFRCNSIFALRRALKQNGFEGVVFGYEAEPTYLEFSNVIYGLGVLHQKLVPGFLKAAIFVFGKKKA